MDTFIFFCATEKGYITLDSLIKEGYKSRIGVVVTFLEVNVTISYQRKIERLCKENNIPFYLWSHVKNNLYSMISSYKISYAIAISWKYMIPLEINDYLEIPLMVIHDSLLPKYRGFAPSPTAIICGETLLGISLIFASDEVDGGEIILQKSMIVDSSVYMKEIIEKLSCLYSEIVIQLIQILDKNELSSAPQDESEATYSIWRSPEDCHIDWSHSAIEVYNFVRAVGTPYPGAYTFMENRKIMIEKTEVVDDINFAIRDVGKIWSIENESASIICGVGMIKITKACDEDGKFVNFNKLRVKLI